MPRPSWLTQHIHGVQPGVLPGRVVGYAGVGARVRGHEALQHQGAAVQVEPAQGGRAGSRCVRVGRACCLGQGGCRPGLTEGGGPRPGPAGHRPSARPPRAVAARQPRSPAAPPAPPGRCAPAWCPSSGSGGPLQRGAVVRPGRGRAWLGGRAQGRVQSTDVPSTATTKSFRASAWAFSATHV